MKIAILTGGGECGGQNAVIKGVTDKCGVYGDETVYIANGWKGLIDYQEANVSYEALEDRVARCGTVIGTSRTNPYNKEKDRSEDVVRNILAHEIDAVIANGGDDTISVIAALYERECKNGGRLAHVKFFAVPKTMDGDLQVYSVGLQTAVEHAAKALSDLKTSSAASGRVGIMEVFGRYVGHTALLSGRAGGADVILIPELGFSSKEVAEHAAEKMKEKKKRNPSQYSVMVVVSEGAIPDEIGGPIIEASKYDAEFKHKKLGCVGKYLADKIEDFTGLKSVPIKYDYLMRAGDSAVYDILYGLRAGKAAVELIKEGKLNGVCVVDCVGGKITTMSLDDVIKQRLVDLRDVMQDVPEIYFGREPEYIRQKIKER